MTPLPSGLSTRPESFAPSGESTLRLQRAIESLALNLDDELHRYRQNRSGQGAAIPAPARLQLRQNRKPIDLIALKTASGAVATAPPPPPPNARLQDLLGQASVPDSQAYPPKPTVNQVRLSHGGTLTTYRPSPEEYLESTEALLGSHPQPREDGDESPPSLIRQLTSPLGMGALLLLLVGSASFGYLVTSPEAVSHLTDNPIARRLKGTLAPADGTASDAAQEGLANQGEAGFKPLGPDLSEQEFSSIDLDDISTLPSANSPTPVRNVPVQTQLGETPGAESATEGDRAAGSVPATPRPGVLTPAGGRPNSPSSPNSAVVRANIVTAPRPAATMQPTAVRVAPATSRPAPAAPAAPATPPPAVRVAPPAANTQPPQPLARDRAPTAPATAAPAVAPPAPITQAPPQAAPSHYVVTDYNGPSSLESARGAVGDAYVRDFSGGTRIQMGAFSQESSARDLQQQLEGQGIPAQVISP